MDTFGNMKANKKYLVTMEMDIVEVVVSAKNKTEARKKAIVKLNKKKPSSMIRRNWQSKRKEIYVDE